jgi:topoisomerase-4 subunit A
MGNTVTKYPVKKILLKSKGVSTLAGRKIWFDDLLKRLNVDGRGKYLGEFDGDDQILCVTADGIYELCGFDLSTHFDDKLLLIEKYHPEKVYSVVHYDGKSKNFYVKRFLFEKTAEGKKTAFISEENGSKMILITGIKQPKVKLEVLKGKTQTPDTLEQDLSELIDVKGMKAMGNRLSPHEVQQVELIASEEPEEEIAVSTSQEVEPISEAESAEAAQVPTEVAEESADSLPDTVQTEQAVAEVAEEPEPPAKSVSFEITNPDDVEIDDKGQLGLF